MTRAAVEHVSSPPTAVNCPHPRVWTKRELAQTIREQLGKGTVRFGRNGRGREQSSYGETERMEQLFGAPRIPVDQLIDRVISNLA